MIIKAGSLLTIECGEYSDFRYVGPFRVLKYFDQKQIADECCVSGEKFEEWHWLRPEGFVAWLARQGYIEDVDAVKWHIGTYRFNPEIQ